MKTCVRNVYWRVYSYMGWRLNVNKYTYTILVAYEWNGTTAATKKSRKTDEVIRIERTVWCRIQCRNKKSTLTISTHTHTKRANNDHSNTRNDVTAAHHPSVCLTTDNRTHITPCANRINEWIGKLLFDLVRKSNANSHHHRLYVHMRLFLAYIRWFQFSLKRTEWIEAENQFK